VSDLRPTSPIRRPDDARPRSATEHVHDEASEARHAETHGIAPPPSVASISIEELASVQRDLVSLPVHAGATLTELDGVSHFWMLQDPVGSAAAIEAFWATLP